jgi:hypothetical protein
MLRTDTASSERNTVMAHAIDRHKLEMPGERPNAATLVAEPTSAGAQAPGEPRLLRTAQATRTAC